MSQDSQENKTFIGGQTKTTTQEESQYAKIPQYKIFSTFTGGCCSKNNLGNICCGIFISGCVLIVLGIVVLIAGQSVLRNAILNTMALHEGSDR